MTATVTTGTRDAAAYLNLYGIKSAGDIQKIQFIGHSEQAKLNHTVDVKAEITDKAEIAKFYNFYSVLKDSSDKYFDALYKAREEIVKNNENGAAPPDTVPPDYKEGNRSDQPVVDIAEPDYAQGRRRRSIYNPANRHRLPQDRLRQRIPIRRQPRGQPAGGFGNHQDLQQERRVLRNHILPEYQIHLKISGNRRFCGIPRRLYQIVITIC